MAKPARPPSTPDAASQTRPASLWPDTTREGLGGPSTLNGLSHFDPLHDEQQRALDRLSTPFDLCRPAVGLRVLLFLQAVAAVAALPVAESFVDWGYRAVSLAFVALVGALLWVPSVCALRRTLVRWTPRGQQGLLMLLGGAAASIGWSFTATLRLLPFTSFAGAAAAVSGAALAWLVWRWLLLRAAAAQPVEASARLAELQSRIRPHFLFNALNTALALVRVDPERAENVLEDLAELFRAALAEIGASVALEDEIELARRYLAIEQLRFGERMQVTWDLDLSASRARVPPLVLQPLVENAVRHGIEPATGGGRIQVRTRVRMGMVEVRVRNTLPEEPGPRGSGIALENVRERLRLLHDVAGTLETSVADGVFQARMMVPL